MGDKIIITDDEDKPAKPDVVVVQPQGRDTASATKKETVVTEKTTVKEVKEE
jgi:hypothetical protein